MLRKSSTKAERLLWSVLRNKRLSNWKFRRQHPLDKYIVDFACVEIKTIVEVDGDYHDFVIEEDRKRQNDLELLGWTVIRYTNDEVLNDLEAVALDLANRLGIRDGRNAR